MLKATSDLMPHQVPAVAKLLPSRLGALYMDMGTGKTRTTIELALIRQGKWDRVFWFTPCSLRENVRRQWLEHTDINASAICVWRAGAMHRVDPAACVHIIGIETMSSNDAAVCLYKAMVSASSFVVADESTYIKGDRAKRSRRLVALSAIARYRMILTGTPLTQGAVDLYGQMRFLSEKILGYRSFWSFAANHLTFEEVVLPNGRRRRTGRIVASHNEALLAARIAPYTYQVRKDECLTLPAKLYTTKWHTMSDEQREAYDAAKAEVLDLDYDDWSPIRIFHLFSSLQAILCGFWRRTDGSVAEVRHDRIDALLAAIARIPGDEPVVIWGKYHYAVRQICAALRERYPGGGVHEYSGQLRDREREAALASWRSGGRFLVATQAIGGHGLTLTEACHALFYADSFKYSERLQAEDRIHRIGQTRRAVYVSIRCSSSIDERIESALERKADTLRHFQREVEACRTAGLRDRALSIVRGL